MVQNDIRFVFTAPLTPNGEIAEHVRLHGYGVHDIAFAVDDVESAWRETTKRGARSALDPTELDSGEEASCAGRRSIRTATSSIRPSIDRASPAPWSGSHGENCMLSTIGMASATRASNVDPACESMPINTADPLTSKRMTRTRSPRAKADRVRSGS